MSDIYHCSYQIDVNFLLRYRIVPSKMNFFVTQKTK